MPAAVLFKTIVPAVGAPPPIPEFPLRLSDIVAAASWVMALIELPVAPIALLRIVAFTVPPVARMLTPLFVAPESFEPETATVVFSPIWATSSTAWVPLVPIVAPLNDAFVFCT